MQKSINGSSGNGGGASKFDSGRPASGPMAGHPAIPSGSINTSRSHPSDHHYQKHQPQTHAGKLLKELAKQPAEHQSNYIANGSPQSTLLKKHVYTNSELDPLNLFHLPEHGNQLDGNPQVIASYEQAKNEQQMLNYYSKALMLTILAGVVMFSLNLAIFLILVRKKRQLKRTDARQKQTENDEQQQAQKQLQQATDHHLKMINNEELVQYEDYLEVNYNGLPTLFLSLRGRLFSGEQVRENAKE